MLRSAIRRTVKTVITPFYSTTTPTASTTGTFSKLAPTSFSRNFASTRSTRAAQSTTSDVQATPSPTTHPISLEAKVTKEKRVKKAKADAATLESSTASAETTTIAEIIIKPKTKRTKATVENVTEGQGATTTVATTTTPTSTKAKAKKATTTRKTEDQPVKKPVKLPMFDALQVELSEQPTERYFVVGIEGSSKFQALVNAYTDFIQTQACNPAYNSINVHFAPYNNIAYETRRTEILQAVGKAQHTHKSNPLVFLSSTRLVPPSNILLHTNGIDRTTKPFALFSDSKQFMEHIQKRFKDQLKVFPDGQSFISAEVEALRSHVGHFPINGNNSLLNPHAPVSFYKTIHSTPLEGMSPTLHGTPITSIGFPTRTQPASDCIGPHPFYKKANQWTDLVNTKYKKKIKFHPPRDTNEHLAIINAGI